MTKNIQPYLFFNGRCEEALDFYRKALNAKVTVVMRYKDSPNPIEVPGFENKVMHANFSIGETQLMASDGRGEEELSFEGFALTLNVDTVEEANGLFASLSEGGQVQMPLAETFYSPRFGMVVDRFGVLWMIITAAKSAQ
jgi:PhnB protein